MCFSLQRRAIFHVSSQQPPPHPPLYRGYFSTQPAHKSLKNTAFRDFPNISRLWIFFLLTFAQLYLLSSDSTSFLCFFIFWLCCSALLFQLSILSEVRLLNFLRQVDLEGMVCGGIITSSITCITCFGFQHAIYSTIPMMPEKWVESRMHQEFQWSPNNIGANSQRCHSNHPNITQAHQTMHLEEWYVDDAAMGIAWKLRAELPERWGKGCRRHVPHIW